MDYRDVASHYHPVLRDVDARRMTGTFTVEDHDGNEIEHTLRLKFDVCDTCDGRGAYVNPSIDSHGLSRDDFDEDPDFAEDYCSNRYDVPCAACNGARVIAVVDEDANDQALVEQFTALEQAAWDDARETTREREMGY